MFVTRSFAVYEPLSPYVHDGVGPLESLKSSSPSRSHANESVSPSSPFTSLPLPSKVMAVPSGVDAVGGDHGIRVALVRRVGADRRRHVGVRVGPGGHAELVVGEDAPDPALVRPTFADAEGSRGSRRPGTPCGRRGSSACPACPSGRASSAARACPCRWRRRTWRSARPGPPTCSSPRSGRCRARSAAGRSRRTRASRRRRRRRGCRWCSRRCCTRRRPGRR